jgi:CubicO group peptidase (beta-lactamase class C family)
LNVLLSEKIWKPAGASHAHWRTYTDEGSVTPYCCLFATVEDWAKVAYFLSKNGMTVEQTHHLKSDRSGNDIQLAGDEAVSAQPLTPFLQSSLVLKYMVADRFEKKDLREGVYGLHVRHDILDREGEAIQGPFTYFVGHGGQLVYMLPEHDLVIVRFGRRHTLLHSTVYFLWRSLHEQAGSSKDNEKHSSVRQ